ncbi:hypothetical protein VNO77_46365 [Canavalia gladiata]|uniref:Uncharacterized protein n=1 Tax=Canavalia gladiata TaxID=3824 RepID=A0AAN9JHK2_CANGL
MFRVIPIPERSPTFGPSEAEKETPKHPRCEKKKGPFSKPFEVDRDKDKRLATELDALNRTHGAVISDAAKKEERLAVKAIPVKDRLFPNTVFLQKPENPIRINLERKKTDRIFSKADFRERIRFHRYTIFSLLTYDDILPLLDYVPADWWEKKKLREKNLASYAIPPNTLNSGGRGLFVS